MVDFVREDATAGAGHLKFVVLGMDIGFHLLSYNQATGGCGRSGKHEIILE
jgi:hypothetical protein